MSSDDGLLTVPDAARSIGVSAQTLYARIKQDQLAATWINGRLMVREADLATVTLRPQGGWNRLSDKPLHQHTIYLRDDQAEYLSEQMGGIAKGVRSLIDEAMGLPESEAAQPRAS